MASRATRLNPGPLGVFVRLLLVTVALLVAHGCQSVQETRVEWLMSQAFVYCDELSGLSCPYLPNVVRFRGDGSTEAKYGTFGAWQVNADGDLIIEDIKFRYFEDKNMLFADVCSDSSVGYIFVPDDQAGKALLETREKATENPSTRKAILHCQLQSRVRVHDACVGLMDSDLADHGFLPALVAVLPSDVSADHRLEHIGEVCSEALFQITGRRCGRTREDWQKCLGLEGNP